jgi:hypothetical protein
MKIATATPDPEDRLSALEAKVAVLAEQLDDIETEAGIERGLDEVNRGLGRPAREIVEELRAKHNLPRT